ncbi:MAG: rRNA maturation RNase YbeY [Patescibacteria group bacterium]|nr:rRNA maturation RNase YbeY [Patescibacteria group bacterium]MCL5093627.1 rRNA maturation RNase YbeY [Patescibacteria group bacterium]
MSKLAIYGYSSSLDFKRLPALFHLIQRLYPKKIDNVNLIFSSPSQMRALNKKYRRKNENTDVLSFAYNEKGFLGEICVSKAKVRENAKKYGNLYIHELDRVIIHGFLHLLGFDHKEPEEREAMEKEEKNIFKLWQKSKISSL